MRKIRQVLLYLSTAMGTQLPSVSVALSKATFRQDERSILWKKGYTVYKYHDFMYTVESSTADWSGEM